MRAFGYLSLPRCEVGRFPERASGWGAVIMRGKHARGSMIAGLAQRMKCGCGGGSA
jgi:hypothetical protein